MEKNYIEDFDFNISTILLAHKFNYSPKNTYSMYMNGRKLSGVVYCISGQALYTFKDEEILLSAGRLLFLPKDCAYIVKNNSDEDFFHITVNFEIEGLKAYNKPYDDIIDTFGGRELLERLLTVWTEKKQGYRPKAKSILYELLYNYFRKLEKNNQSEFYEKIMPAKHILDKHYRENLPISYLASVCGFSETHFRRTFSNAFECSPTEYRLKKRITLAKELLENSELTISEISTYIGFDDSSYFCRIFKSKTGYTPSKYARNKRM